MTWQAGLIATMACLVPLTAHARCRVWLHNAKGLVQSAHLIVTYAAESSNVARSGGLIHHSLLICLIWRLRHGQHTGNVSRRASRVCMQAL